MTICRALIALVCGAIVSSASMPVRIAQSQQLTTPQLLQEIRVTADAICQSVQPEQTNQNVSLSGEANAKVNGLIAKFADFGVAGAGQYQAGSSRGVLQKDLVVAIQSANDCKREVFRVLAEKLLPGPIAPSKDHTAATAQPVALGNISGQWRDNWGNVYQITQQGNEFTFSAVGLSCKNMLFQSSGRGKIAGNSIRSSYQSSVGSRGECSGTVAESGVSMICDDTLCGKYNALISRQ